METFKGRIPLTFTSLCNSTIPDPSYRIVRQAAAASKAAATMQQKSPQPPSYSHVSLHRGVDGAECCLPLSPARPCLPAPRPSVGRSEPRREVREVRAADSGQSPASGRDTHGQDTPQTSSSPQPTAAGSTW